MTWKGPFKVVEVLDFDYVIDMGGKKKVLHANMLKLFHRRECASTVITGETQSFDSILSGDFVPQQEVVGKRKVKSGDVRTENVSRVHASVAVIEAEREGEDVVIPTMDAAKAESISDIHYSEDLSESQRAEMRGVFPNM